MEKKFIHRICVTNNTFPSLFLQVRICTAQEKRNFYFQEELMNRHKLFLLGIAILVVASVTSVLAQKYGGTPNYDPKTETKVSGTIEDVQQHAGRHGWVGIHLMLKTGTGMVEVHVGPANYISQQKFSFLKGDQIEVLGSLVKLSGSDALLAREITKEGKVLTLRTAQGVPLWSGGRQAR
jgi:hypothetical protein